MRRGDREFFVDLENGAIRLEIGFREVRGFRKPRAPYFEKTMQLHSGGKVVVSGTVNPVDKNISSNLRVTVSRLGGLSKANIDEAIKVISNMGLKATAVSTKKPGYLRDMLNKNLLKNTAPQQASDRASTSKIDISINIDKISAGIKGLTSGLSLRSVPVLKTVRDYYSLRTKIASSPTVHPEMQKSLEKHRKILSEAMGFGEQIERLEKLANDSKLLSTPANARKLLAEVTKLIQKLESEVEKLEKQQRTLEVMGRDNPRMNAAADVIDVALIKLDQVKSKVVQKLPVKEREAEETRHFKQDLSTKK